MSSYEPILVYDRALPSTFSAFFPHAPKFGETSANKSIQRASWIGHTSNYKRENLQGKRSSITFFELCVIVLLYENDSKAMMQLFEY